MDQSFVNYIIKNDDVATTLLINVIEDNNVEILQYLLDHKLDPNMYVPNCFILMKTVEAVHCEQCESLLRAGANPNQLDLFGNTVLHRAVENRLVPIVKLLLRYKVDPSIRNNLHHPLDHKGARITNGKTAKDIAVERGYGEIVELLSTNKIVIRGTI